MSATFFLITYEEVPVASLKINDSGYNYFLLQAHRNMRHKYVNFLINCYGQCMTSVSQLAGIL